MGKRPADLSVARLRKLGLPAEVQDLLLEVRDELNESYREDLVTLIETVRRQSSALERIQRTLQLLVERVAPDISDSLPAIIRAAGDGEEPDLATALVVSDPIGSGYTLNKEQMARALGLPNATDLGILTKAFKLDDAKDCAVVVRAGRTQRLVNYHPRALRRFLQLLNDPPDGLTADQKNAIRRVKRRIKPS